MSEERNASDASRQELAADRTDYAEDRTVLANERTFAGWMRTGLAAIGIGVGFQALFQRLDPAWVPKAAATLFILLGIFIFWSAERRACAVFRRLNAHEVRNMSPVLLRWVAGLMSIGALTLIAGIWLLTEPRAG